MSSEEDATMIVVRNENTALNVTVSKPDSSMISANRTNSHTSMPLGQYEGRQDYE